MSRIGRWIKSRLNRKIFICFLTVSLIPLCLVYAYINSSYSGRLRRDAVTQNQLVEKNTSVLLEDYLTKIEYISNLFYDSDIQDIIRKASGPLLNYNAKQQLEKKVRVNLDLFRILDDVDQVTFIKKDGGSLDIMNAYGYGNVILFEGQKDRTRNRYKNQILLPIDELDETRTGKYVYIRSVNDLNYWGGSLGTLYIVFDKSRLDRIFDELGGLLDTRVVLWAQGKALYSNLPEGEKTPEELDREAASFSADGEIPKKSSLIKWGYTVDSLGIRVMFYDHMGKIEENVRQLSRLTGIVIAISILVIFLSSLFFSRTIVRPVTRLSKSLQRVREGDFSVRARVETNDELGDMCHAFNDMAKEIDRLINQVYAIQLKENEASIKALQAQINPHFLYNTLDMIKSMAEIYGAGQVSEVTMALSGMFRYATRSSGVVVTVQEELQNLQNYMKIVNMRFGGGITCRMDVPEELLSEKIVRVCLQPIVENAVSHGLGRGGTIGTVSIKIRRQESCIRIEVEDDGAGMEQKRLEEIRNRLAEAARAEDSVNGGSVGLKNIHDRIRLYYGTDYGIQIESEKGKGTKVTLCYPAGQKNEEFHRDLEGKD